MSNVWKLRVKNYMDLVDGTLSELSKSTDHNLCNSGSMIKTNPEFVAESKFMEYHNSQNICFILPSEKNTALLLLGRQKDVLYGVLISRTITTCTGKTVRLTDELKNYNVNINNKNNKRYSAKLTLGGRTISIEKFILGLINELSIEEMFNDTREAHHYEHLFDLRQGKIGLLTKEEHNAEHKRSGRSSHARDVMYVSGTIPSFIPKKKR